MLYSTKSTTDYRRRPNRQVQRELYSLGGACSARRAAGQCLSRRPFSLGKLTVLPVCMCFEIVPRVCACNGTFNHRNVEGKPTAVWCMRGRLHSSEVFFLPGRKIFRFQPRRNFRSCHLHLGFMAQMYGEVAWMLPTQPGSHCSVR